eukprot:5091243-Karenia_brevis.AAC.1
MQADKTLLSKCRGTPWNHREESRPGRRRQQPVVILTPNQDAEEEKKAETEMNSKCPNEALGTDILNKDATDRPEEPDMEGGQAGAERAASEPRDVPTPRSAVS